MRDEKGGERNSGARCRLHERPLARREHGLTDLASGRRSRTPQRLIVSFLSGCGPINDGEILMRGDDDPTLVSGACDSGGREVTVARQ